MAYCDRCDRYFTNDRALQQHEENSSMHNICHRCQKDFSSEWGLTQHYVQSPIHHYCQRCDDHFRSAHDLTSHYEDVHYYCQICNSIFDFELGLHEHNRQKHPYCTSCKRVFQSQNHLNTHLRSSIHQPLAYTCPGRKCGKSFVSTAALLLHFESGSCPSGVTRHSVDRFAIQNDSSRVITNPARLIRGPDGYAGPTVTKMWATERAWNGNKYECFLCHREYRTLSALNQHLGSAAHADKIYRCPTRWNGCGTEFRTLSALCQHVESEQCGVRRFNDAMQNVLGSLSNGMRMLTL
ncbi:hypothetical protein AcV5_010359 [Taiwanofungus camphoratus]|nr:hypothetical protein AcV5_010359 [Antrodia cinnamomea]